MNDAKLRDAEQVAEALVRDQRLTLPVDVLRIAKERDITVAAKPQSASGVSGMLIRKGETFAICYATHISSEGFQRFSIAHELGHYFLPGHPETLFDQSDGVHESRAGFGSGAQIELEADHFAAELLMPSHLFAREAARYTDGLPAVEKLAEGCKASLTAAAIRYAATTDAAISIVMSSGSSVEYCFSSAALRRAKGYRHPKKSSSLPADTLTREFNRAHTNVENAKRGDSDTDLQVWFHTDEELAATEEVVGLGSYGRTLTIITADLLDEDDAGDDAGRWPEPKFSYR